MSLPGFIKIRLGFVRVSCLALQKLMWLILDAWIPGLEERCSLEMLAGVSAVFCAGTSCCGVSDVLPVEESEIV